MNLNSHLVELEKKHTQLSEKIELNQLSPGVDTLEIGELKKEKLRLKEKITKVASQL